MATYVLIPGAASSPWHWHLLETELHERGHAVVVVDLPCDDDAAGLSDYADIVLRAIEDHRTIGDLVLVAHSFAGFTAPLVAARTRVDLLVMLNAMIPLPGETPGEWWAATGHAEATRAQLDDGTSNFFHDMPPTLAARAEAAQREQSSTPFIQPWPLPAWPDVATNVLVSRDDRFFPAAFQRQVALQRLGLLPEEMDGGHFVALSRPQEVADRLEAYRSELRPSDERRR